MSGWRVRPSTEQDWRAYRAIRLEMLGDTPIAYLETLEHARTRPDEHWHARTANQSTSSRLFAAVDDDGRWLGTMGGFHTNGARDPLLVGVYVTPPFRGRDHGMADALLDAVIEWARDRSDRLLLQVHEANEAAKRFYLRRGFEFTGASEPYPLDRTSLELEMVLRLR